MKALEEIYLSPIRTNSPSIPHTLPWSSIIPLPSSLFHLFLPDLMGPYYCWGSHQWEAISYFTIICPSLSATVHQNIYYFCLVVRHRLGKYPSYIGKLRYTLYTPVDNLFMTPVKLKVKSTCKERVYRVNKENGWSPTGDYWVGVANTRTTLATAWAGVGEFFLSRLRESDGIRQRRFVLNYLHYLQFINIFFFENQLENQKTSTFPARRTVYLRYWNRRDRWCSRKR